MEESLSFMGRWLRWWRGGLSWLKIANNIEYILKGCDDGVWNLAIIQYSEEHIIMETIVSGLKWRGWSNDWVSSFKWTQQCTCPPDQWLGLAVFNRPSRVRHKCLTPPHLRKETDSIFETLCSLEYWVMDRAQNPSNPKQWYWVLWPLKLIEYN